MDFRIEPSVVGDGELTVPGDKSVSHRALMLGGIANGTSHITGFLAGEDCLATLRAMCDMGVTIEQDDATTVTVHGVGMNGLRPPGRNLDLGNSGTAMRLMCGLMAGQAFGTSMSGDHSLNGRPMNRVIRPLTLMGANIESNDGKPPLTIIGGRKLNSIIYELPVASAQVKSCILLAGMYAEGTTSVYEPAITRDHTERMLRTMGVELEQDNGWVHLAGGQQPVATDIEVPADLSSAAFVLLAAVLADSANILVRGVGVNPTRTGVIDILQGMGADIVLENPRHLGSEPVADIRVRSSTLHGGDVDPALVSLAIDEFPVLFVAAAAATGRTTFSGIGELRVKESDRIAAMATGLRALGITVDEADDGAVVHGGSFRGGTVESFGDHRIAMALALASTIADGPVIVRNVAAVNTSFPDFVGRMSAIGVDIATVAPVSAA
jgi:3-phosphoshikimate 1-carboxyvinyltransferase